MQKLSAATAVRIPFFRFLEAQPQSSTIYSYLHFHWIQRRKGWPMAAPEWLDRSGEGQTGRTGRKKGFQNQK